MRTSVPVALACLLSFIAGCSTATDDRPAAPSVATASASPPADLAGVLRAGGYRVETAGALDCRDPIARERPGRADRVAFDSVALAYATQTLPGSAMPGFHVTKVALKVNTVRPVTITSTAPAYFVWGNRGLPAFSRTFTVDCSATAAGEWLVFPGSVVTRAPQCLLVTVTDERGRTTTVPLGLGDACPAG